MKEGKNIVGTCYVQKIMKNIFFWSNINIL